MRNGKVSIQFIADPKREKEVTRLCRARNTFNLNSFKNFQ